MTDSNHTDRPPGKRRRRTWLLRAALAVVLLGSSAALVPACTSPIPNRVPVGETFPTVAGEGLDGVSWTLPADLDGEPAVLLLGYVMKTQFDLDRWLLGLLQAEVPARILELPTIKGLIPGLIAGTIDEGMRSGIPPEDWAVVVTVYGSDAKRLVELTGNEGPRNTRVVLVDGTGTIRWFHDRGYSAGKLLELDAAVRALGE